jgi:hypothetical protein
MPLEDRSRIAACLANIGGQLTDMPDELSAVEQERLLHLMWLRDSLRSAILSNSSTRPLMMTLASTLPWPPRPLHDQEH